MSRFGFVVAVAFAAMVAAPAADASSKKGLGISGKAEEAAEKVNELNVSWYYTWSPRELTGVADAEFVPLFGINYYQRPELLEGVTANGKAPVILGYNEPDLGRKGKPRRLDVEEAVEHWDELEELAVRIGSPAPVRLFNGWLEDFMTATEAEGLRVDFIAVHWYGPPKPQAFLKFIDRAHAEFQKPIWVTEFAVKDRFFRRDEDGINDYSEEEVLDFMKAVLPELERRPFVERYAWFGASRIEKEPIESSQFYDDEGNMTELGRYYADFERGGGGEAAAAE